ncbi:MAG: phosphate ABC transporter substrate-binding/OmpA family protein [Neomegalonema sp.]|nr:phosphate ABC transporter substrate-binding/OmpA family protein [Neomegalonema sp.]
MFSILSQFPRASALAAGLILAAPGLGVTQENDFGIHGSNTVGANLMPALIEGFSEANGLQAVEQPSEIQEEVTVIIRRDRDTAATIDLQRHGSSTSFKGLMAGQAEIGMSSRRIKDKEVEAMAALAGVADARGKESEHVLALDGLAVIVSNRNPLNALSMEEIAKLFSGEISNWSELGLPAAPVTVYARDNKSGTYDTFKSLVLKPANVDLVDGARRYESNEQLARDVAADPNAIGFTALAYSDLAKTLSIRLSCGMEIFPTQFNVKAEEYPLGRRLYLYTADKPKKPMAQSLLAYAVSDDAQPIISKVGFVDQSVRTQEADAQLERLANSFSPSMSTEELAALRDFNLSLRGYSRASTTFRFEFAKSLLDTKALVDAGRVARFLQRPENKGVTARLIGFADSIGGYQSNLGLARARAESVERAILVQMVGQDFDRARLQVETRSTLSPVACNDSEDGRAKNRRVELWLSR